MGTMKRSERVTIALLGIVIGVTGSYTWSTLTSSQTHDHAFTYSNGEHESRAGHGLVRNVVSESHATGRARIESHTETEDGFLVQLSDGEMQAVGARVSAEAEDITEYNTLITTAIHPNGTYLAFCHTAVANEGTCRLGVYDPEEHRLYEVEEGDTPLVMGVDSVTDMSWSDDGTLSVAGYRSFSVETPWEVE